MNSNEIRICGLAAVRARFQRDSSSIVRLYFDHPTSKKIGVMCRALASARKVYRCVEPAELEKIAESVHHGGIVAVVAERASKEPGAAEVQAWFHRHENLVVLDRIGNAHNLGAIARSAAYFGVPRIVVAGDATSARPGAAAYRVAEGGLELLEVRTVPEIAPFLRMLSAAGYDVVGAATRGGSLVGSGAKHGGPWVLVLGNEERGLSAEAQAACSRVVTIGGDGKMESLNVSAAAAVLLYELGRRAVGRKRP